MPPGTYTWIPFGGGRRRCLGASFALQEMKVVIRAVLEPLRAGAGRPPRPEQTGGGASPSARRAARPWCCATAMRAAPPRRRRARL